MQSERNLPLAVKAYLLFTRLAGYLQCLFLLAIRLCWGWQFFQTGKGKLLHLDKTAAFFKNLGIPAPKLNALVAGSTECFGGLLLCLGLGSRIVSVPLIFTMLVAYWTAERADIHSLDDFFKATPFLFLMTVLIVLLFGPGKASIDYVLERTVFRKYAAPRPLDDSARRGFPV